MSEKITIGGIEVPEEDWEKTPESVKAAVTSLSERLTAIEERLGLNSENSSIPPSKQAPERKKREKRRNGGKRGGQKGHKGFGRNLYETSECEEVIEHKPQTCKHCGGALGGEDPRPYRHQIVELPDPAVMVVEHQLHGLRCECCGKWTRAHLPEGTNRSGYGERLQSVVAVLGGEYHLSHSKVAKLLKALWGVEVSQGSISRIRQRVSEKLKSVVEEAKVYVQQSEQANLDETRWAQHDGDGQNPERSSAWLWMALSHPVAVYRISLSRAGENARALLGDSYRGIVNSDRFSGYNWLDPNQRQVCWAHLKQDFTRIAERRGVSGEIGCALLRQTKRLFRWWYRVRDGTLSYKQFESAMTRLRLSFQALLAEGASFCESNTERTPLAKTARTCQQLLKLEPALWRFTECDGVEPTNNAAERALRGAVIWRGLSFGSQSRAGCDFVERMLTVTTSLRLQGRAVLPFLTQVLRSQPASLLPYP